MRYSEIITESPQTDRDYRLAAKVVFNQMVTWVANRVDNDALVVSGGIVAIRMHQIDMDEYAPLVIILSEPMENNAAIGTVAAAFGVDEEAGPYILMTVPDLSDPELANELRRNEATFIHEFQHYLDHKRSGGKMKTSAHAKTYDEYFNNPSEVFAYYQEGMARLSKMMPNGVSDIDGTTQEKVEWIKSNCFDQHFIQNLSPRNLRKINARIAKDIIERP